MQFAEIQRRVMDYLRKTDVTHHIKNIINSAMRDIEREHNFNCMLSSTSGSINTGDTQIATPSNLKELILFAVETGVNTYQFLRKGNIKQVMENLRLYSGTNGLPTYYAVYGGYINFYPKADKDYNYYLDFYKYTDELVNETDSNFWTNQGSDILIYMSLFEAYNFLGDTQKAVQFYQLAQAKVLDLLRVEGNSNITRRVVAR